MADSKQHLLASVNVALTVLPCLAVLMRLVARRVSKAGWWWDDFAIAIAWATVMTENSLGFWAVASGLGEHEADLGSEANLTKSFYTSYLAQFMVHPCLASCKLAVCLFYGRLFSAPNFRRAIWTVATFIILWFLGTFPVIVLNCVPVKKIWLGPAYPGGHCVNLKAFLIGQAVPNSVLDVALLALPLSFIWRLQMSKTNKIALSFVFCVGFFELGVSIIRLVIFTRLATTDPTYNDWESDLWSSVEVNVGLMCACLLGSAPLLKLAVDTLKSATLGRSGNKDYRHSNSAASADAHKPRTLGRMLSRQYSDFTRLDNGTRQELVSLDNLTAGAMAEGRGADPEADSDAIRLDEIHVTREVMVSQQERPGAAR